MMNDVDTSKVETKPLLERINEEGKVSEVAAGFGISRDLLSNRLKAAGYRYDNAKRIYKYEGVQPEPETINLSKQRERKKSNRKAPKENLGGSQKAGSLTERIASSEDSNTSQGGSSELTGAEIEILRDIIKEWDSTKEGAATTEKDTTSIYEQLLKLDATAEKSRRAYNVNRDVWKEFDKLSEKHMIEKGQTIELALVEFIERYGDNE
ncbi:hypothetical protein GLW00_19860 [Halobacillus litoralis]|uniref:Uncharacterized protein n=1 Tax=Halobacillus litoralis TaxID=45668 RepID=A0A845FHW2_9BACI|nr:hypothetical protein [Halobacillus litoralis]MYL73075.1 hypothetical protein [Halobacillus litoralis]